MLLDNVFTPGLKRAHLVLLEHDLTRSTIPIIRDLIHNEAHSKKPDTKSQSTVILATFLHPSTVFVRRRINASSEGILERDYTSRIGKNGEIPCNSGIQGVRGDLMEAIQSGESHFRALHSKTEYRKYSALR